MRLKIVVENETMFWIEVCSLFWLQKQMSRPQHLRTLFL